MVVPQLPATDVRRGSDRAPGARPDRWCSASRVARQASRSAASRSAGWLGESRSVLQLGDARPCGGQPALVGGDVAIEVGQPAGRVRGAAERAEPAQLVIAPALGLGQRVSRLLVLAAGGVGGRAQDRVFGVGVFGGAACGGAERGRQRRPVVGPVGDPREPAGVGGQLRQVWAPPVGPVGELLAGAGDGGPSQPKPARAVQHHPGRGAGGVPFAVPATRAGPSRIRSACAATARAADLDLLRGLVRGDGRLSGAAPAGLRSGRRARRAARRSRPAGRASAAAGKMGQAALLGRPRLVQLRQDLLERARCGVAGGLGGGQLGGVAGAEVGPVAAEHGDPLLPRLGQVGRDEVGGVGGAAAGHPDVGRGRAGVLTDHHVRGATVSPCTPCAVLA